MTSEELHDLELTVNGDAVRCRVPARRLLSDLLRDDLGLTGTHVGCEHGVCGACTVMVDGRSTRSCLMFAVQVSGSNIATIEGHHGPDGALTPLQEAFWEAHALQCGFCTPALILVAQELIDKHGGALTYRDVQHGLGGNLCRCTGYQHIVEAVLRASRAGEAGAEADAGV